MNTATTTTVTLNEGFFARRNWLDWLFAAIVVAGGLFALQRYAAYMDVYEKGILLGSIPGAIWLGWFWRPLRTLMLVVAALSLMAIGLYQQDGAGSLERAEAVFGLKYFLSSQSAILWMSVVFFMSTIFYWIGMFSRGEGSTLSLLGSRLAWVAVAMALIGTMVRWYESYLLGPDVGHIPVSNLYEVFVMFCWMTALFYLYYEEQYQTRSLGAFVMLVVSAAVGFLLWYTVVREAHEIQPLVPALKSWWMKLHVPANFIGYGTFALSAMVAFAYLIKQQAGETRWYKLAPLWLLGVVLCFEPLVFRQGSTKRAAATGWCISVCPRSSSGPFMLGAPPHWRAPAVLRGARRRDVQVHRRGLCLLHHCHGAGRALGRRGLGWLLELGPQGNLGADRLAQLRRLAAHAPDEGAARHGVGLVGAGGAGGDHLRLPRRQHVPVGLHSYGNL
jgi:hypothetical protein